MRKVLTSYNPSQFCAIRRTVRMPGPLPKYAINLTAEQDTRLQQLSLCYTAPFAEVQRARMLLLAHQQPEWRNADIARQVGCAVSTVKLWRQRWQSTESLRNAPRPGCRRTFTALQRTRIIALACSSPQQYGRTLVAGGRFGVRSLSHSPKHKRRVARDGGRSVAKLWQ